MGIRITYCCDCCGEEISEKDGHDQKYRRRSATKEWPTAGFLVLCENCATKIDYSILKLRSELGR